MEMGRNQKEEREWKDKWYASDEETELNMSSNDNSELS